MPENRLDIQISDQPFLAEVLRAGDYTDMNLTTFQITEELMDSLVASYEEDSADVRFGHYDPSALAAGWVKRLYREGDSVWCEIHQLTQEAAEILDKERIKYVSAGVLFPNSTASRSRGDYTLDHLALTNDPAVPVEAIRQLELFNKHKSEDKKNGNEPLTMRFSVVKLQTIKTGDVEMADKTEKLNAELEAAKARIAELESAAKANGENALKAELEATKTALKEARDEIANAKTAQLEAADNDYAAQLVKDGKIQEGEKEGVVALLSTLRGVGDEKVDAYKAQLEKREPVEFGDGKLTKPAKDVDGNAANFSRSEITEYAKAHNVGVAEAVRQLRFQKESN